MKLKSIKKIKKYKSFQNFTWQPFFNNETFHDDINILYGENGSGKSCICNILKSVSQNKNFTPEYKPEEVCLSFDDGVYKYPKNPDEWDKRKDKEDILFFDREFVDKNIHLGHNRDTQKGGQEQESGKMIIEFDSEAINLRDVREEVNIEKEKQGKRVEKFRDDNKDVLSFQLSDEETQLFQKFKNKTDKEIKTLKVEIEKNRRTIEKELETDQSSQKKVIGIQNSIYEIETESEEIDFSLLDYKEYQAVFNFDLKEQVKIKSEQSLIEKLRLHKEFFETGFEIRKKHPEQCPFCQSRNEEKNIKKIIKIYNEIYDDTYKKQVQHFSNKKQELIGELEFVRQELDKFGLNSIFLELKKLDQNYKIKGIYAVEEEKSLKKPQTKKITELSNRISKLKKPNKENIKKLYDEVEIEFKAIENLFSNTAKFIEEKNKLIRKFKLDNTDEKLQTRIIKNRAKLIEINQKFIFFNEKKIDTQKRKEQKEKEFKTFQKLLEDLKEKYKNARIKYENYASKEAFTKILQRIEEYFKNFNFSFKLELDTERRTGITKEFPFAFKVLDSEDNERDLKEGLSEGELQVLSLCFFFAFLDMQKDRKNKILVFDDPITSLDNSNLSCLVDLISIEKNSFSQIFVFTHHRTFFNFLRKKFKEKLKKSKEYNVIRNKKELGGSFICKSKAKKFINKLKNFEEDIYNKADQGIDIELKIIEYGQYLRYEIERFIKNDLLHWNTNDFPSAIEGVKNNKSIHDDELDIIKQVYSFCNWTTSHVSVGDDHGLEQLKGKISDFIGVYKKE